MLPSHYSLPSKFATFRSGQQEAMMVLALSNNRFNLYQAGTGSGKSLVYMAVHQFLSILRSVSSNPRPFRTLVLVPEKLLQDQVSIEFSSVGAVDIRGRANYRCKALDAGGELSEYGKPSNCGNGPCILGVECSLMSRGCLYFDAIGRSCRANLVITNPYLWMSLGKYSNPNLLGEFDLLVVDEAHRMTDALTSFSMIKMDNRYLNSLGIDIPKVDSATNSSDAVLHFSKWAKHVLPYARHCYKDMTSKSRHGLSREAIDLARLGRDLVELERLSVASLGKDPWVLESNDDNTMLSPIWPSSNAERWVYRGIRKIILTSATLSKQTAKYIGVNSDSSMHKMSNKFSPHRRPFYYINRGPLKVRVDFNTPDGSVRSLVGEMDKWISRRLHVKGIVHSRSFKWATRIKSMSQYADVMITHKSKNRDEAINRFMRSDPPCILVSPSVEAGYDFADDLARWGWLWKVPRLDMRDFLQSARQSMDKKYSITSVCETIEQITGRTTRSNRDYSETVTNDAHFGYILFSNGNLFTKSFRQAVVSVRGLPEPLGFDLGRARFLSRDRRTSGQEAQKG